jgi:hypothetical protein
MVPRLDSVEERPDPVLDLEDLCEQPRDLGHDRTPALRRI